MTNGQKYEFVMLDAGMTLGRLVNNLPEVWWPKSREWHPYIWNYKDASPISEERAQQMIGDGDLRGPRVHGSGDEHGTSTETPAGAGNRRPDAVDKILEASPRAHPMYPEDRLTQGTVQVTFFRKRP